MDSTISKIKIFRLTDKTKEWMVYGICLLCLALFATAAYSKVAAHETFLKGLSRVSFIGGAAVYLAWLVPAAEILISVLLIVPQTQRWGLYAFTGLMAVFTVYIASMLFWAERLPCHCNLVIEKLSWGQHVWFNLGFIALSMGALWLGRAKNNTKIRL
jgi:uncharacterized membrane protein YphA (DoxX/SURF4 family)